MLTWIILFTMSSRIVAQIRQIESLERWASIIMRPNGYHLQAVLVMTPTKQTVLPDMIQCLFLYQGFRREDKIITTGSIKVITIRLLQLQKNLLVILIHA